MRFGADLSFIATSDPKKCLSLCASLAPDILDRFSQKVRYVTHAQMRNIHPNRLHWTEVWAATKKPHVDIEKLFMDERISPLIVLEDPKNLGNLGACIRTSAALGASGVIVLGDADPWNPRVIQAASGTQFALPVGRVLSLPAFKGELIVCDPKGDDVSLLDLPADSIFFFGTERDGVSSLVDMHTAKKVSIPMKEGVSSLNLAVSVGAVLSCVRRRSV